MNLGSLMPWRERAQMPATRDGAYDPFLSFRREMDRVFDDFLNSFGGRAMQPSSGGGRGLTPSIDVAESDKEVVVTADLPGLDNGDFEVTLTGDMLTIRGEKKEEREHQDGETYVAERRFGRFSRSLRLPFEVKDENVDAHYDKGVLTVRIPKPEGAPKAVRHIEVKAA